MPLLRKMQLPCAPTLERRRQQRNISRVKTHNGPALMKFEVSTWQNHNPTFILYYQWPKMIDHDITTFERRNQFDNRERLLVWAKTQGLQTYHTQANF